MITRSEKEKGALRVRVNVAATRRLVNGAPDSSPVNSIFLANHLLIVLIGRLKLATIICAHSRREQRENISAYPLAFYRLEASSCLVIRFARLPANRSAPPATIFRPNDKLPTASAQLYAALCSRCRSTLLGEQYEESVVTNKVVASLGLCKYRSVCVWRRALPLERAASNA